MGSYSGTCIFLLTLLCFKSAGSSPENDIEEDLFAQLQHYLQILRSEGDTPTGDVVEQKQEQTAALTSNFPNDNKVEGRFVENGRGIYFLCEDDGDGKGTLLITSIEGKMIFYVEQIREDLLLVSVEDESLLHMPSEQNGGDIFEVPSSHLIGVLKAMEGDSFSIPPSPKIPTKN